MNSLHRSADLLHRWIRLSFYYNRVYISCLLKTHVKHLFCKALVHVIYYVVSGQYSYTIPIEVCSMTLTTFHSMHYYIMLP